MASRLSFPTIWPQSGSDSDAAIKEASFKRHAEQRHIIDLDNVLSECKFCREAFPDRRKATKIRRLKDPLFEIETTHAVPVTEQLPRKKP